MGKMSIRRGIFQGDFLYPLLFITVISLTHILRQNDARYRLGNGHRKINHLLFMDDLKLYGNYDRGNSHQCTQYGFSIKILLTVYR